MQETGSSREQDRPDINRHRKRPVLIGLLFELALCLVSSGEILSNRLWDASLLRELRRVRDGSMKRCCLALVDGISSPGGSCRCSAPSEWR